MNKSDIIVGEVVAVKRPGRNYSNLAKRLNNNQWQMLTGEFAGRTLNDSAWVLVGATHSEVVAKDDFQEEIVTSLEIARDEVIRIKDPDNHTQGYLDAFEDAIEIVKNR